MTNHIAQPLQPAHYRLIDAMVDRLVDEFIVEQRTDAANSDAHNMPKLNEAA